LGTFCFVFTFITKIAAVVIFDVLPPAPPLRCCWPWGDCIIGRPTSDHATFLFFIAE
jgi:hypothetical protein